MSQSTRREFLKDAAILGAGINTYDLTQGKLLASAINPQMSGTAAPSATSVTLAWLGENPPAAPTGVSWGVSWPPAAVSRDSHLSLRAQEQELPLQSWPLAFWPDGSLKWSGFTTVVPAGLTDHLLLYRSAASTTAPQGNVGVTQEGAEIIVDTGAAKCSLPKSGANVIGSITLNGKQVVGAAQLVCVLQSEPQTYPEDAPPREKYLSEVKHVTVEQSGPVRAVVKIEGMHRGATSKREWLQIIVRPYFYSGQSEVRLVHTIIFDGDQEQDFIRGLGLQFDTRAQQETTDPR